jgi:hypothetical protein
MRIWHYSWFAIALAACTNVASGDENRPVETGANAIKAVLPKLHVSRESAADILVRGARTHSLNPIPPTQVRDPWETWPAWLKWLLGPSGLAALVYTLSRMLREQSTDKPGVP